jgi:hypothetical protein
MNIVQQKNTGYSLISNLFQNSMNMKAFQAFSCNNNKMEGQLQNIYQTTLGPTSVRAFCQPAAHIWGPSIAIANGVSMTKDIIDKQA